MLDKKANKKVYLACGKTDLRKSIDGLSAIVEHNFNLNVFSNCYFVFCNKNKDKIKILYWESNGFWLYYKRLESEKFKWPENNSETLEITEQEFRWLLDGLEISKTKLLAHKKLESLLNS